MFTTRDPDEPRLECLVLCDQQLPIVDYFVSSVNSESPESVKLIYSKYFKTLKCIMRSKEEKRTKNLCRHLIF